MRLFLWILLLGISLLTRSENIFLEVESFGNKGGWVVDNQSMRQIGSSYLLAHGLGIPVENASTQFRISNSGKFRIWVRTRNWVKRWSQTETPGRFKVVLNGLALSEIFGTEGGEWHWQDGGIRVLKAGENKIELQDLTGFDGRCDAVFITSNLDMSPPASGTGLAEFRRNMLGYSVNPEDAGSYDLVVVGGGIAGCCAAISAARLGCKVALIQNRSVLGGNNSSEVRVGLSGLIAQQPYSRLGYLVDELGPVGFWNRWEAEQDSLSVRSKQIVKILEKEPERTVHNAGPSFIYEDNKKIELVQKEDNLSLFLNMHVVGVQCKGNKIFAVVGRNIESGKEYLFRGKWFSDCTGDGEVGFLSGADYRMGRESKAETAEPRAPMLADQLVMGTSVQWYAEDVQDVSTFPSCPWAVQFNDTTCIPITRGDWDWEVGLNNNQIDEIEYIRDYALCAIYGNWDFLKNKSKMKEQFSKKKLAWVAYIGGKRESRRLMGDFILSEQDILDNIQYEDATFTTTWGIDLHYPKLIPGMDGEPFLSYCDVQDIKPYAVPYRCLYSRNIENLFMAGRNISVTHVALGTVRVMRTGGMMGEVVGMAVSLCKKHETNPRTIYTHYLSELKTLMLRGVGKSGFPEAGFID